jgi:hypothetical protein
MTVKYCRIFFCHTVLSAFSFGRRVSVSFPPFRFDGRMLPVTLLSYDEKEKWHIYSGTFPYSRAQIVSSKYVFAPRDNVSAGFFAAILPFA